MSTIRPPIAYELHPRIMGAMLALEFLPGRGPIPSGMTIRWAATVRGRVGRARWVKFLFRVDR